MAKNDNTHYNNLFSSVISEIKTYSGRDSLLPWLRGIKRMKDSLPPQMLKEKLPRFLQKCAESFKADRRYRNDSRYIRIWLQLMDFVDDPKALLRAMEENQIGTMRSFFYQAYALYYEKMKKYEEAEKIYRRGVQNLAEPVEELQKSYEQFLNRMERHNKKRIQRQEGRANKRPLSDRSLPLESPETKTNKQNICKPDRHTVEESLKSKKIPGEKSWRVKQLEDSSLVNNLSRTQETIERQLHEPRMAGNDDTVVTKFVDTAIVGKSEAEDACHHGLVDPTINMKEAMNAINSMFKKPIETGPVRRRSQRNQQKEDQNLENGFEDFVDENLGKESRQGSQRPFEIYIDDDISDDIADRDNEKAFVFIRTKDHSSESSDETDRDSPRSKFREDTVVHRFVGSTILDEPHVENVCHHGLVDPTINLKEAMDDINNMFGKPIDFVGSKRSKRQEKAPAKKEEVCGFSILEDGDDVEHPKSQPNLGSPIKSSEDNLFEPTVCMKEAMDEINRMFGMPLDF